MRRLDKQNDAFLEIRRRRRRRKKKERERKRVVLEKGRGGEREKGKR